MNSTIIMNNKKAKNNIDSVLKLIDKLIDDPIIYRDNKTSLITKSINNAL